MPSPTLYLLTFLPSSLPSSSPLPPPPLSSFFFYCSSSVSSFPSVGFSFSSVTWHSWYFRLCCVYSDICCTIVFRADEDESYTHLYLKKCREIVAWICYCQIRNGNKSHISKFSVRTLMLYPRVIYRYYFISRIWNLLENVFIHKMYLKYKLLFTKERIF